MNSDLYAIIGVTPKASQEEIKQAYRDLSKALHPDVNPRGAVLMQAVNEAYGVLGDPAKRKEYDRGGKVKAFPPAAAARPVGVNDDGSFNVFAIAGKFTPAQLQDQIFPAIGRLLSDRGIQPDHVTVESVLTATGVLKKKKGVRKSA